MSMDDIIIHLFCRIADELKDVKQHHQANLHPSEIATIGVLNTIKGLWISRLLSVDGPQLAKILSKLTGT